MVRIIKFQCLTAIVSVYQGRSALWAHLKAYKEAEEAAILANPPDPHGDDLNAEGTAGPRGLPPSGYLTVGHRPRASHPAMGMGPGHMGTLPRRSLPGGRASPSLLASSPNHSPSSSGCASPVPANSGYLQPPPPGPHLNVTDATGRHH